MLFRSESVRKGRRAEARAALAETMQQQERYMTQYNTYKDFSLGDSSVPFKTKVGDSTTTYKLKAEACPASGSYTPTVKECIKVVASPVINDPLVGDLSLTSTGVKDCTGSAKSSQISTVLAMKSSISPNCGNHGFTLIEL